MAVPLLKFVVSSVASCVGRDGESEGQVAESRLCRAPSGADTFL